MFQLLFINAVNEMTTSLPEWKRIFANFLLQLAIFIIFKISVDSGTRVLANAR